MQENKKNRLGEICCALGAICWGVSGTCGEALFREYAVETSWVTAIRMTSAGVILMLLATVGQKWNPAVVLKDKKGFLQLILFAVVGLAMCQFAYLSAIRWTNSGTATVLQNISVVMIAVVVCVKERKLPERRTILCIFLALAGIWLIATGGQPGNMEVTPKGLFWGIGAALGATAYTLLSRAPVVRWGSVPVTGAGMLIGGLVLFVAVRAWQISPVLDGKAILLLAIIVLVGTVGAFTLFLQGISMAGPVKAILLGSLEPVVAALLSAVWLGSTFSPADLVGFACILTTVFLLRKS